MKKYEYKVVYEAFLKPYEDDMNWDLEFTELEERTARFNKYGSQGWKIIKIEEDITNADNVLILEREVVEWQ